jgi:altronate dehydratase
LAIAQILMEQDSGKDYRGTNPTQENIAGGLTTLD